MSEKIIISYSLSGIDKPLKITRKIYGYIQYSNKSKYKYRRLGILSNIKNEKLSRACIILDKKDSNKIILEFKKLGIKLKILDVNLKNIEIFE